MTRRQGTPPRPAASRSLVLAGLAASALLLAVAPAVMPAGYSWVSHTTSESAAQGVPQAWVARLGFVLFGTSVLTLAATAPSWGRVARGLHAAFGVLMVGAAAFSHRPWLPGMPVDETEDLLHSVAATGMGLAFAAGVLVVGLRRRGAGPWPRVLDAVAVVASVALPAAMSLFPAVDGVLQRLMFAVAYAWYAVQAVQNR